MAPSPHTAPQPHPPLTVKRLTAILLIFTVVLTLGGSDMTKVVVALPVMSSELGLGPLQTLWTADIYALATGVAMIPSAVLADRLGRKLWYSTGLALAVVSAVIAGAAPGAEFLIAGRIGQGIGAAMLIAGTVAIIRVSFPTARSRGFAYGLWVASFSAGIGLGPLIGGFIVESLTWNWVFWMNVPVLGLALLAALAVLPESKNQDPPSLDPLSMVASTITIMALILALKSVAQEHSSVNAVALLGVGLVALLGFCLRQRRLSRPYLDIALFRNPLLAVCALSIAATTGLFNGTLYLLSQQVQVVGGQSPTDAGLALLPLAAASVLGGVLAPALRRWVSGAHTMVAGFIVATMGALVLIALPPTENPSGLLLLGLGAGAVMAVASHMLMSSAPTIRTADAGAIQESAFALGAGAGIAALGTFALHLESIYGYSQAEAMESAMGFSAFLYGLLALAAGLVVLAQGSRSHEQEPGLPSAPGSTTPPR
ncbi:MFS transporter [Nesterenkonia sp. Hz 6-5]|nr:MFS transporter [Nesterenkonia haasae]